MRRNEKEYYRTHNIKRRAEFHDYYHNLKTAAIKLLGGKCIFCGFDDERALQFDHIDGGGVADKKTRTTNHYKHIIQSILNDEKKYQLLCANCNWIKRFEKNEVRKVKI